MNNQEQRTDDRRPYLTLPSGQDLERQDLFLRAVPSHRLAINDARRHIAPFQHPWHQTDEVRILARIILLVPGVDSHLKQEEGECFTLRSAFSHQSANLKTS